ncbi:MAG: hypothetical protein LKI24_07715, partial [Acidipropionibacterium sp.]|nr:hypothetical protein [Acidipropionibacterium sp.]
MREAACLQQGSWLSSCRCTSLRQHRTSITAGRHRLLLVKGLDLLLLGLTPGEWLAKLLASTLVLASALVERAGLGGARHRPRGVADPE